MSLKIVVATNISALTGIDADLVRQELPESATIWVRLTSDAVGGVLGGYHIEVTRAEVDAFIAQRNAEHPTMAGLPADNDDYQRVACLKMKPLAAELSAILKQDGVKALLRHQIEAGQEDNMSLW